MDSKQSLGESADRVTGVGARVGGPADGGAVGHAALDPSIESPHSNETGSNGRSWAPHMVGGARYVLDQPPGASAVWGDDDGRVLWAEGEALMIVGPQGVGKTTLVGQVLRGLLGVGSDQVLDLPVLEARRVLYLAMDRPRQIARSLRRGFSEADRAILDDKLIVWKGPPPHDIAANPGLLLNLAEDAGADVVIVDSLKDAALGLSKDEVGAAYNRARQALLNSGRQIAELHHIKKVNRESGPVSIDDVYGSTWLTSGAGSVILLDGQPGDPIVNFRHVKQPAEEVGPFRLLHDQESGSMTIEHRIGLVVLIRLAGAGGLSARAAATSISVKTKPSRPEVEKVRRRLDKLVESGMVMRSEGTKGGSRGGQAALYFLPAPDHGRSRSSSKLQFMGGHAPNAVANDHAPITSITERCDPAGLRDHTAGHVGHAEADHVSTPPFEGRGT